MGVFVADTGRAIKLYFRLFSRLAPIVKAVFILPSFGNPVFADVLAEKFN
jgi:hypothetical protein